MKKVTKEDIKKGFDQAVLFYENKVKRKEAVDALMKEGISNGTAGDLVNLIKTYLKPNSTPTRTMSILCQTIFFKGVLERYGKEEALKWVQSDLRHFNYYEETSGARVVGRRNNLKNLMKEL